MFSASETRSKSSGFGRFLSQLAGLVAFGFVVWAGLFAAASWQHERRHQPGVVAAANAVASTEYLVLALPISSSLPLTPFFTLNF